MAGSKLAKFLKWGKLLKIPGISLLVGAGLAGMYAADGRWGRAGLELLSGALGTFPGVGTALAFALDAGLLVEDLKGTKYEGQFNKYKNAFFKDPGTAFNRQEVRAWQAKGYASAGYNEKVHGPRPSKAEFKRSLKMGREQALARAMKSSGYSKTDLEGITVGNPNAHLMNVLKEAGVMTGLDKEGFSGSKVLINQDNSTTLSATRFHPITDGEPRVYTGSVYPLVW
jgi:hypothetical protein